MPADQAIEPRVILEPLGQPQQAGPPEAWTVRWRLTNQTDAALRVLEIWFPHTRYFAARQRFDAPPFDLPAGASAETASKMTCGEPPGSVIENAFMILQAAWGGERWRLLARLTVTVAQNGVPIAAVQAITAQRAGFSPRSPNTPQPATMRNDGAVDAPG